MRRKIALSILTALVLLIAGSLIIVIWQTGDPCRGSVVSHIQIGKGP